MAIRLNGIHILLTYTCNYECDHCFVWGGPFKEGTLTLDQLDEILTQAAELRTVEWIYFEGGEPFRPHFFDSGGIVQARRLHHKRTEQ